VAGIVARAAAQPHPRADPPTPETGAHRAFFRSTESAAETIGVAALSAGVREAVDIERAINSFAEQPDGGLIPLPHPLTSNNRDMIIALAARHRLPAVYPFRYFATAGGLLSLRLRRDGLVAKIGHVRRPYFARRQTGESARVFSILTDRLVFRVAPNP
jgi:hypothetical protein